MMSFHKIRRWFRIVATGAGTAVVLVLAWALLRGWALSLGGLPEEKTERLRTVTAQLDFLEDALKRRGAARAMQGVFPEGACFILTLYGMTWANVAQQTGDGATKDKALAELRWALQEQDQKYAVAQFTDTQVRRGVFWMGQRNMLLGRMMEIAPAGRRPAEAEKEFHENSRALAEAFRASPTHHLDSYEGDCWPADNVTALISLLIHDRLYGSDYGRAWREWKAWTEAHADPPTGLPAGKIDRRTGYLGEPARGCANSWIAALAAAEDPEFAGAFYQQYLKFFELRRLGFAMLREYPQGSGREADVDSGPVVWGAGMTATGVGLAAARACGDMRLATDIYNLAGVFGWPRRTRREGRVERDYLFGCLPMADAFLAWGLSVPPPQAALSPAPGVWARLRVRWSYHLIVAGLLGLLGLREYWAIRRMAKRKTNHRPEKSETAEPQPLENERAMNV